MAIRVVPHVLLALVSGAACAGVNTIPDPVSPTAAIQFYDLEIPPDLEIRSVDFAATSFADVFGVGGTTSSSEVRRAFVKVYAVRRTTGEQFLLLYEDVERRKRPIQVIRFVPGGETVRADSTH